MFGFIKTKAAAWAEKETKEGRAINVENRGCDICDEDFDTYPDGPEPVINKSQYSYLCSYLSLSCFIDATPSPAAFRINGS